MTTVGIAGVTGRMGLLLAEEISRASLAYGGGSSRSGTPLLSVARQCDVIIDFTSADAVAVHAAAMTETKTAWVLGTSGLNASQEAIVRTASADIAIVYAPNYAPGVNLVLALAERMAAALPASRYDAEIVEMHHRQKVDAPSGTAIGLGRAVARGRGGNLADFMVSGRDGHTEPRREGTIGFSAMRGGQVVGEHTLLFAAGDEHIAITHRAFDRRAFAVGAIQAAQWVADRAPGLYDMMDVLGMR